ncbi:MAG: homoserine dehydrogenase [bacterium]
MDSVKVGLIGFGTIGTGVVRILTENAAWLARRAGVPIRLKTIVDIDLERDRGVPVEGITLTHDIGDILGDPEIRIVIELVGGIEPASTILLDAMSANKDVVTANKALLAAKGPELFQAAVEAGVDIGFEASVAGGIPIVRCIKEGLAGDRIRSISGIINGTSNYVLSTMTEQGRGFSEALKQAQELGYAEADPSLDIDGHDTAHKLSVLVGLAYGMSVRPGEIFTEGIREITDMDIAHAGELGYRIKLLALSKRQQGTLEVRVHPTMISARHPLASVGEAYNAIYVMGEATGPVMFYGQGAGMMPTASAVASDLIEISRNLRLGIRRRMPPLGFYGDFLQEAAVKKMEDLCTKYYIRFPVEDRPGVLSKIAGVLGDNGISLHSVIQHGRSGSGPVHIIMLTHEARERSLQQALSKINGMQEVLGKSLSIRIEDALNPF